MNSSDHRGSGSHRWEAGTACGLPTRACALSSLVLGVSLLSHGGLTLAQTLHSEANGAPDARVVGPVERSASLISAPAGDEQFLNLRIEGELRPETSAAIARLLEPGALTRLRILSSENAEPLEQLCERVACPPNVGEALAGARALESPHGGRSGAAAEALNVPAIESLVPVAGSPKDSPLYGMTAQELEGREVYGTAGEEEIGEIDHIVVNHEGQQILAAVSVGGFLGARSFAIPLDELQASEVDRITADLTIAIPLDELQVSEVDRITADLTIDRVLDIEPYEVGTYEEAPPTRPLADVASRLSPPKRESFAVLAPGDPILEASGVDVPGPVAVPINDPMLQEALARGDANIVPVTNVLDATGAESGAASPGTFALVINREANDKLDLIERDLQVVGSSDRQYRLSDAVSDAERSALLEMIRSDPAVNADVVEIVDAPTGGFSFIHPPEDAITFQATAEECREGADKWPFDAARIAGIMAFNEEVRRRLGLTTVRRSRVLVIDTGLGGGLAQNESFRAGLFADPDELLASRIAYRTHSDVPDCLDRNDNSYYGDVYGAAPLPGDDDPACRSTSYPIAQIGPLPRKRTSKQIYMPEHGSFVSGLALGGPDLIAAFPDVTRYIGLSFFRITRSGESPAQSVKTDSTDLAEALRFAGLIGADVVNLSLKTRKEEPFRNLDDRTRALLVTSAGNEREDLDLPSVDNRPASLTVGRDRMLVVAALQPAEESPWWPQSAHSKTTGRVDIAAPGARMVSFGPDADSICANGTSAAAPLVSFTAAMLKALGLSPREAIRARVLASAEHDPRLTAFVAEGRRLNVAAALDLYVDQVQVSEESEPRRGWIEPEAEDSRFPLCPFHTSSPVMAERRGVIDLSLLWSWRREAGDEHDSSAFYHRLRSDLDFEGGKCEIPGGSFRFFNMSTGKTEPVAWAEVQSILPTPFRAVKEIILELGRADAD